MSFASRGRPFATQPRTRCHRASLKPQNSEIHAWCERVIDHDGPTATFHRFTTDTYVTAEIQTCSAHAVLYHLGKKEVGSLPFPNSTKIKMEPEWSMDKRRTNVKNNTVEFSRRYPQFVCLKRIAISKFIECVVVSNFTQNIKKRRIKKSVGRFPRIDSQCNHCKHFGTYKYRITSMTV
ncbi:unannotated protein [freshwater metagenome]|uniref:Unannotated protein n=1 Tax=freshwater metagenome TaxID=449393 RepID=A0A6J6Y6H9_9ZZZZ